jgi:putative transposase
MQPGLTYHLYTHANGFENLFRNEENFRCFLKQYEEFKLNMLVRVKSEAKLKVFLKIKF